MTESILPGSQSTDSSYSAQQYGYDEVVQQWVPVTTNPNTRYKYYSVIIGAGVTDVMPVSADMGSGATVAAISTNKLVYIAFNDPANDKIPVNGTFNLSKGDLRVTNIYMFNTASGATTATVTAFVTN